MSFTDEDLKRLKDDINQLFTLNNAQGSALLARLEAAENPARKSQHSHWKDQAPTVFCRRCEADEAWRKTKGE